MTLLAIDPSTTCTGLAVFRGGKLWGTRAVFPRKDRPDDVGARAREMVWGVINALDFGIPPSTVRAVHSEWPQIYRASRSKGDPNDLPAIAGIAVGIAAACMSAEFRTWTPQEWAGQIPKESERGKLLKRDLFTNARAEHIASRLSVEELNVFGAIDTYDELDAIGIGLHALGRGITKRHRVMKGAT